MILLLTLINRTESLLHLTIIRVYLLLGSFHMSLKYFTGFTLFLQLLMHRSRSR